MSGRVDICKQAMVVGMDIGWNVFSFDDNLPRFNYFSFNLTVAMIK
jgi:hypothetical protein